MENKIDVTASLDKLLGVGRFACLMEGTYTLTFFQGIASDISMIVKVSEDGTLKTRTTELIWMGDSHDKTIHVENMSSTKVTKLVNDQFEISASLTRVCNDFLEKAIGELSDIENSTVEGDIILDYQKVVSLGQFEVEVLYNTGGYECTVYPMYEEPQKFYTKDIDRVESFLSKMKKKWDNTVKKVVEEELSKIGD